MGDFSSARKIAPTRLLAALSMVTALVCACPVQAAGVKYTAVTTKVKGHKLTIYSKPTDDSAALRIVSGPGSALWFGELGLGTIVKFSTRGKAFAYTVPIANAAVRALVQGQDGNMWFADFNSDKIGRVTEKGKFKTFDTAANPTKALQMVLGNDGNLYFDTDFNGIGKIDPSGNTTFLNLIDNNTQPTSVTVGPSNEIWFAEWAGSNVGYFDSGGNDHEFDAGFAGFSNTFGIAYGSDGRIWFCDPQHQRIGAINANGTHLKFYTKKLTGSPDSIVAGPDGNLYFGEFENAIGMITTAGAITEFPVPASEGSFPVLGLAVGPDGNIWFANNAHAQIGRLALN